MLSTYLKIKKDKMPNCIVGVNPVFKNGIIGIYSLYAHRPELKAYFSRIIAATIAKITANRIFFLKNNHKVVIKNASTNAARVSNVCVMGPPR